MTGSNDKYGVSFKDVVSLIAGDISDEKRQQLAKAIYDPDHPLSYLARQASHGEPFISEWPPAVIPPAIKKLLGGGLEIGSTQAAWLEVPLIWKSIESTLIDGAVSIVSAIRNEVQLMPLPDAAKQHHGAAIKEPTDHELALSIAQGKPITAANEDHWLHVIRKDDSIRIRAGRDSAHRFDDFTLELRRGEQSVLLINASDGEIVIAAPQLDEACEASDKLVIHAGV